MTVYRSGYRYQLDSGYEQPVPELLAYQARMHYATLEAGTLSIAAAYAWDGMSGPVLTTRWNIRASLIHDALYQLIRETALPPECRPIADVIFRRILIEDGVLPPIAWLYYSAVRLWGDASQHSAKQRYIITRAGHRRMQ